MKRYLIFASPVYYPTHAPYQVKGSVDSLDQVEAIIKSGDCEYCVFYSVLDLQERTWAVIGQQIPNVNLMNT